MFRHAFTCDRMNTIIEFRISTLFTVFIFMLVQPNCHFNVSWNQLWLDNSKCELRTLSIKMNSNFMEKYGFKIGVFICRLRKSVKYVLTKEITVRRSTTIQDDFINILNNCTMASEVPMWYVDALNLKYHKRPFQYWDR